jgi:predicted DCC family thiol-disulfide oxidoreductase YuxK
MISLISEMTDTKGRQARGWLFFDEECKFCSRLAARLQTPMRRRGLDVAPLQDPRVATLLGVSRQELLQSIRYAASGGNQYSGAEALVKWQLSSGGPDRWVGGARARRHALLARGVSMDKARRQCNARKQAT